MTTLLFRFYALRRFLWSADTLAVNIHLDKSCFVFFLKQVQVVL